MAKSQNLNITQEINTAAAQILTADTTTKKTLYTASADDAVVKSLMATSNDTAAMNIALYVNDGTLDRWIGTVNVPTLSGTNGTAPAVDLLSGTAMPGLTFDQNGKRVLPMKNGHILKAAVLVTVTAAKEVNIFGVVEEY